jgi:hypothetical protein
MTCPCIEALIAHNNVLLAQGIAGHERLRRINGSRKIENVRHAPECQHYDAAVHDDNSLWNADGTMNAEAEFAAIYKKTGNEPPKCECCGGLHGKPIGVASSALGAISFAWCHKCLTEGAEPEIMFEHIYEDVIDRNIDNMEARARLGLKTCKDGSYITFAEWYAWRKEQPDPPAPTDEQMGIQK